MRIVQFIASGKMGGAENFTISLCNALALNGNHIYLFLPRKSALVKQVNPLVHIHIFKTSINRHNPFFYWELYRLIKNINPDIIHTHGAKATKFIYNLRHTIKPIHIATKHNARKGAIFNRIKHVIGVSKESVDSVKNTKATLIHNGIVPEEVMPSSPNKVFTILAVGRLDPIKGFDKLIEACSKLTFDYRLEIIGEGPWRKILEKQIKKLHLHNHVFLLGFSDNIPQKMHDADLVVSPSHSEGFSLVMIEALFYAKLFIATPVGGAKEILDDFFLATHEELHCKIKQLYQNHTQSMQLFQIISNHYKRHLHIKYCSSTHQKFYEKLKESR
jgi:glycosyltransferase involved in cell wall biosynthesis